MKRTLLSALLIAVLLSGCSLPSAASPTPTWPAVPTLGVPFTETATPIPLPVDSFTPVPTLTPISAAPTICTDPKVVALLDSLKVSILDANGALLSSLVSPQGMEVRYFRNGAVITYTPEQAKFLFETTYEANWGAEPGSGLEKKGSFHDVVVPDLAKIFNQPYTLHCNELRHGGATYELSWPYAKDFYSIHFTGTEQYGYLDWHTWAVGVEYANGKPVIYALMNFFWEP